jgi:hypothetical protein
MLPLVVVTLVAVSTTAFSIGGTGQPRRAGTNNAAVLVSRPAEIIMKMAKIDDNVGGIATSNNSLNFASSILDKMFNNQPPFSKQSTTAIAARGEEGRKVVESYIASLNSHMDTRDCVRQYFTNNVEYIDASSFYTSIVGTEALIRHCYLHAGSTNLLPSSLSSMIVIDNIVASTTAVCFKYHLATTSGVDIADTIGIVFCNLQRDNDSSDNKLRISRLFNVGEPTSPKPGNSGLQLLRFVSKFINANEDDSKNKLIDDQATTTTTTTTTTASSTTMSTKTTTKKNTIVEQYFEAWNARNMTHAASLFTTNCQIFSCPNHLFQLQSLHQLQ